MHVGRTYPWHFEVWPVSALWWPGYVPRNITLGFPLVMPVGLTFLSGYLSISGIGSPAADFESVDYLPVELPVGVASLVTTLQTVVAGDEKYYDAGCTITMDDDNVLEIGARLIAPRTTPLMQDLAWRSLNGLPIVPVYIGGSIAPTPWADLSPPTSNARLGRWLQSGAT